MTFEMPTAPADTASLLRELEASAPNPVPKTIRAAMIQAARELEDWRKVAKNGADMLDEAQALRISQMDTVQKADEVQRRTKQVMAELSSMLRALA